MLCCILIECYVEYYLIECTIANKILAIIECIVDMILSIFSDFFFVFRSKLLN